MMFLEQDMDCTINIIVKCHVFFVSPATFGLIRIEIVLACFPSSLMIPLGKLAFILIN